MEVKEKDQLIGHLGLVSAMCDEIGLVELINEMIPDDPRKKVSSGTCAKIMVVIGLGFVKTPLYLFSKCLKNKPVDRLFGSEIQLDDISDDLLGRTLDRIDKAGSELIFSRVATRAARHFGIDTTTLHFDTTSKVLFGQYEEEEGKEQIAKFGYSKDKRPNLKQVMFSLMVSNEGNFPLMGGVIAGNTSDSKHFKEVLKSLEQNLCFDENDEITIVADAALYSKETLKELQMLKWITRVPETIKEAKQSLDWVLNQTMVQVNETYSTVEIDVDYGVKQRWLIVRSQEAYEKAVHTVAHNVKKEKEEFEACLKKHNSKGFSCESDALKALKKEGKKLKYHIVSQQDLIEEITDKGRGKAKPSDAEISNYKIKAELDEDCTAIEEAIKKKSMFILATNQLDKQKLDSEGFLLKYKDQHKVERGNRFLKNPLCITSAIFLKNQNRIRALGVIMLLCYLIYTALEFKLRRALVDNNQTIPNQLNKPTNKPTAAWAFSFFSDVIIKTRVSGTSIRQEVSNLCETCVQILRLLGEGYMQMYCL